MTSPSFRVLNETLNTKLRTFEERKKFTSETPTLVSTKNGIDRSDFAKRLNSFQSSEQLSPETLTRFFDLLKPGGRLGIFVLLKKGGGEEEDSSAIQKEVSKRLTLEGFEEVVSEQTSVSGTSATKVSGRKPKWERGVTFSLGEKKTKKTTVSHSAWEEDEDDRDEMIDEDALLTEKDKAKPTRKEKELDVRRRGNRAKIAPAEGKRKRR